jgi:uncharacterized protein YndB with AHSA1/START domain
VSEPFTASIDIAAPPIRVFDYFSNPEAMIEWIGNYAVLDARPGGKFTLDIDGIPVRGRYLEFQRPERIVVSWGHAESTAIPPGSTQVEFRLEPTAAGTRVTVEHRNLPEELLPSHRQGWPMFLGQLATAAG